MSLKSFLHGKLIAPVINQLKQGITPQKIAQSIAVGFVMGCFPILGLLHLCVWCLGLFLNSIMLPFRRLITRLYPVQLALLIPFYRAGEKIFGVAPIPLNVQDILNSFQESFSQAMQKYLMTGLRGVVAWLIVSPIALAIIYKLSFIFLKKVMKMNTIPKLGYGVWQVEDQTAVETVRLAIDAGYRSIDTAAIYNNEIGVGPRD